MNPFAFRTRIESHPEELLALAKIWAVSTGRLDAIQALDSLPGHPSRAEVDPFAPYVSNWLADETAPKNVDLFPPVIKQIYEMPNPVKLLSEIRMDTVKLSDNDLNVTLSYADKTADFHFDSIDSNLTMAKVPSSVFLDAVACMDSRYMSGHTVDTGHAFIVSPGTYEPYIGIHDPVYGAGYMMVDLDKPFEIPMNRIWIAMDDYSGPETKEGLRGMYHSPQDVSAFSDPFCGSVSVTPTRDEKQKPAKSGLEAKRDACAISAAHLDSPNTEIPDGKNMERE